MKTKNLTTKTIDACLRDKRLLGAGLGPVTTWATWLTILRAAFGTKLTEPELAEFAKIAGGRSPPDKRVRELWAVAGRRSGKSRMAAAILVYTAVFLPHKLAKGETGHVLCLSASKAQAQLIRDYALGFIEASPILRQQLVNVGAEEITLAGNIVIGIHTNSFRTVRGRTILACVFDESAFWRDETRALPDIECLRAVKPSLDASGGLLVGISSPYRRVGLMATRHRDYFGRDGDDVLIVQAASLTLNPTIDERVIVQARADDPASALSEWDGEFRTDLSSLLADDVIDRAIDHSRPPEIPYQSGIAYRCFVDASAGRHDAFTLCIGHVEGDDENKSFVADVLRAREPPFDMREVTADFTALAKQYRCNEVIGDAFAGEWVRQAFVDAGVSYRKSDLRKSDLYLESLSTFNTGRVSLPNDAKLVRELRMLERQTHRSGRDTVDHPKHGSDDRANVVVGCMWVCGVAGTKRRGEVMQGFIGADGAVQWLGQRRNSTRFAETLVRGKS